MLIARVIGDITATQKHPSHEGKKLLLVQPLDLDGSNRGMPVIAVDSVSAGIGAGSPSNAAMSGSSIPNAS